MLHNTLPASVVRVALCIRTTLYCFNLARIPLALVNPLFESKDGVSAPLRRPMRNSSRSGLSGFPVYGSLCTNHFAFRDFVSLSGSLPKLCQTWLLIPEAVKAMPSPPRVVTSSGVQKTSGKSTFSSNVPRSQRVSLGRRRR
jgi:hypothetical protein